MSLRPVALQMIPLETRQNLQYSERAVSNSCVHSYISAALRGVLLQQFVHFRSCSWEMKKRYENCRKFGISVSMPSVQSRKKLNRFVTGRFEGNEKDVVELERMDVEKYVLDRKMAEHGFS